MSQIIGMQHYVLLLFLLLLVCIGALQWCFVLFRLYVCLFLSKTTLEVVN